jgi:uncharacterized membrane protein YkoI
MTKKTRSPAKQPSSPNPRPKQRNRQTSVDRFFASKQTSRATINEAMSSNTMDSPTASDNESNNPYDVLRDEDEDEVLTDVDQKSEEESDHSARSEPSESEYESATDTASLGTSPPKTTTEPDTTSEFPATPPQGTNSTDSNHRNSLDTEASPDSPDFKPRAKDTNVASSIPEECKAPDQDRSLQVASRRLFDDNRKKPPSTTTTADEITPSVLDDLLYEARQYDATLIAASGTSTTTQLDSTEIDQDKQAKMPSPKLPGPGRWSGTRRWPSNSCATWFNASNGTAALETIDQHRSSESSPNG